MTMMERCYRPVIMGRHGAVASNHPAATQAGIDILRTGGNAVDAAVAVSLALGVAEPFMSGLGGDGFYHVWRARDGLGLVYNGTGASPAAAVPGPFSQGIPLRSPLSISVPGAIGALHELHKDHGSLPWVSLCQPSIQMARDGVPASHTYRRYVRETIDVIRRNDNMAAIYLDRGEVPDLGTLIVQNDLSETLGEIAANGTDTFYRGAVAKRVIQAIRAAGGLLESEDFDTFEVERQTPISIMYRGYEIRQTPPNSMGFALLQQLKIAERFNLASMRPCSAELVHLLVEIKKRAFIDRERFSGWSETLPEYLLSDKYADEIAGTLDLSRSAAGPPQEHPVSGDTTYFCVVDSAGNAVSAIQSLNSAFGSGFIAGKTGILMNNRMIGWHLEPTHPNRLAPGRRVRHTMNAPIVVRDGQIWCVLGTPGADDQVQVNMQAIVSLIDHTFDPQQAAEAPRWSSSRAGEDSKWPHVGQTRLRLEGFDASVVDRLSALGHQTETIDMLDGPGSLQCIRILPNGIRVAGSDPRRDGWAAAF